MDPEQLARWQAADSAFDHWLDLPDDARRAWLDAQSLPAPVRQRLDQLIAAHGRNHAGFEPARHGLDGRRLGDWTLGDELGHGGMAIVHRASRTEGIARQQAAIKILTLGAFGSVGRERFRREAEILARLNHPNITPLIDSGIAADGTCWMAMPLVEGERLDRWCDAHAPDAHAVVRLYLQVCGAVAYAHRNLVIHRDIKPSNVLVDADGHIRLLDFGIGQFADAPGERTHTIWRALTPGYAAPEQLRGDPPSTAIDVYGLGALLHRLLTGRTPQVASEWTETTRPSLLVRDHADAYHRHYVPLRNDLDRVLLKALAEAPEQRYSSAEAFADDLRRWLDGRPVSARMPTVGYRARKFISRNRVGVAAGVLLALSLGASVTATLWHAGLARSEAANARAQAKRAILVRDFLQRVFQSTDPASGGVPDALELLNEGARRARSDVLATDPLAAADILMLTGRARLELDESASAQADLEQALTLLDDAASYDPAARTRIRHDLSRIARDRGDNIAAVQHARAAVELGTRVLAATGDPLPLVEAGNALGMSLFATEPDEAKAVLERVLETLPDHGLLETEQHLVTLDGLSTVLTATDPDDLRRQETLAEEQIRLSRLIDGPASGRLASTLADQVPTFGRLGNPARAEALALEAITIADRAYLAPHSTRASVHCQYAANRQWQGRYPDAIHHFDVSNAIYRQLGTKNLHVQACFLFGGYSRAVTGDYEGALADVELSWDMLGQLGHWATPMGLATCGTLAGIQLRMGHTGAAADTLAACPVQEHVQPPLPRAQAQAELHFVRGEFDDAVRVATALRKTRPPETGDRYWMRPWMLSVLLAHTAHDQGELAMLTRELRAHAATSPLSDCLARPGRTTCLALP